MGHTSRVATVGVFEDNEITTFDSEEVEVRLDDLIEKSSELPNYDSLRLMYPCGHSYGIQRAEFSPNGKFVFTVGFDQTIRVWSLETGMELQVLSGYSSWGLRTNVNADGTRILARDMYGANVRDVASGNVLQSFNIFSEVGGITSISPDGNLLVSDELGMGNARSFEENTVSIWDVLSGSELKVLSGHTQDVSSADFSADGKLVFTTSLDTTARIWDVGTGKQLQVFKGHKDLVQTIRLASNGSLALTASLDNTARLWNVNDGQQLQVLSGHKGPVMSASFSIDEKLIITTSKDSTARLWDSKTGNVLKVFSTNCSVSFPAKFSQNGHYAIIKDDNNNLIVYDVTADKDYRVEITNNEQGSFIVVSPNAERVLFSMLDGAVKVLDIFGEMQVSLLNDQLVGSRSITIGPDGNSVLTADENRVARIWKLNSGHELQKFIGHESSVSSAIFSPDGKRVLTVAGNIPYVKTDKQIYSDNTARIWDATTGTEIYKFSGHRLGLYDAMFSNDGGKLFTLGYDSTARIWNAATGEKINVFSADSIDSKLNILDRKEKYIICGGDSLMMIWDVENEKQLHTISFNNFFPIDNATLSSDEKWLISNGSGTVILWNVLTGKQVQVYSENINRILSTSFNLDSKYFLIVDEYNCRIMDVINGKELKSIPSGYGLQYESAIFSSDGRLVITLQSDNSCRIYDLAAGKFQVIANFKNTIYNAIVTLDGKYLITTDNSQTMVTCLKTGVLIYTRVEFSGGDWLLFDEQNRFDGSARAIEKVYFVRGLEELNSNELRKNHYTPGLAQIRINEIDALNVNRN